MPSRAFLSEEAEAEEEKDRDRLRTLRTRLRDLVERRRLALMEVRRLSEEQKSLFDARRPGEREVERVHDEYRELGSALAAARKGRDEARVRLDEAIASMREFQTLHPRRPASRPEDIRRQIAELERRQQTSALPLAEENALIDQLRGLVKRAAEAEKDRSATEERESKLRALEAVVAQRRTELKAAQDELPRLRAERDRRMQSMRGRLEEAGALVARIREKANARGAAMDRLRAVGAEIEAMEREADAIVRSSKGRRDEARKVLGQYRREAQANAAGVTEGQVVDRQLEELLKRGRITLGG